jgi:hypothetical protein
MSSSVLARLGCSAVHRADQAKGRETANRVAELLGERNGILDQIGCGHDLDQRRRPSLGGQRRGHHDEHIDIGELAHWVTFELRG